MGRALCRAYVPILLVRSLVLSGFLVGFSSRPVVQAVGCLLAVAVWDVYSFFACPYHFYVRVFVRLHELAFTLQVALLTVCVAKPEYSRVGAALGIQALNGIQVAIFVALGICILLDRIYNITCLKRERNAVSPI